MNNNTLIKRPFSALQGHADALRFWISRNIAIVMFLGIYFLTVVVGNFIYATPYGKELLLLGWWLPERIFGETTFSLGFWALLLMPFAAVPAVQWALGPFLARRIVEPIVERMPNFTKREYVVFILATYAIIAQSLIQSNAINLLSEANTGLEAIEARFILQKNTSFIASIFIHSILPALTFYSVIAAMRESSKVFWITVALTNVTASFAILILINMKWPVLVFLIGIVVAIFIFSRRQPYAKSIVGAVFVVAIYLLVSTFVFRADPASESPTADVSASERTVPDLISSTAASPQDTASDSKTIAMSPQPSSGQTSNPTTNDELMTADAIQAIGNLVSTSVETTPMLMAHAINRMASSYPVYYEVFTKEGPVCGTFVQHMLPGAKPCYPSHLVYSRIFPNDGFEGRGTAPQAPHITAYAMGGWLPAVSALFMASVVLVAFTAIPFQNSTIAGTMTIVGAVTGYHMSQVPIDGVIRYSHGLLWILVLLGFHLLWHLVANTIGSHRWRIRASRAVQ